MYGHTHTGRIGGGNIHDSFPFSAGAQVMANPLETHQRRHSGDVFSAVLRGGFHVAGLRSFAGGLTYDGCKFAKSAAGNHNFGHASS